MQLLHSPTPLCRCAMADGLYLCLEISFFQKFKSSILFLLKSSSCSQGSILFTLLLGLFSQHLQGTIPLEIYFSLTPSEIFSNTLPVLDLQSLSTVLKSSRFGALAIYNQPDLSFLRLVTENSIRPALTCTVQTTQFTLD
jgi:hypothetical protein